MVTTAGTLIRSKVSEIGVVGRNTQGVILMRVSDGEKVNALSKVPPEDETISGVSEPEIDGGDQSGDE